jgi:hypothetical protein
MATEIDPREILSKCLREHNDNSLTYLGGIYANAMEEYFQLKYKQKIEEAGKELPSDRDLENEFEKSCKENEEKYNEKYYRGIMSGKYDMKQQALPIIAGRDQKIKDLTDECNQWYKKAEEQVSEISDLKSQLQAQTGYSLEDMKLMAIEVADWKDGYVGKSDKRDLNKVVSDFIQSLKLLQAKDREKGMEKRKS